MKSNYLITALLLISSLWVRGQIIRGNIISNASFEASLINDGKNFRNDKRETFEKNGGGWLTQAGSSPDIIDGFGSFAYHEYDNFVVKQFKPHEGAKCAGIRLYGCTGASKLDCREYLVRKLDTPMIVGNCYHFELWAARITKAFATKNLSVFLSDTLIDQSRFLPDMAISPQINSRFMMGVMPLVWYRLADTIVATKPFSYIYIGNFVNDKQTIIQIVEPNSRPHAYYFIDDIRLFDITDECHKKIPPPPPPQYATQKNIILKNVLFETDKAIILPQSFPQLDSVVVFLKENPQLSIQISGHTDNQGSEVHNLKLSEKRAAAIVAYFQTKGIDRKRTKSKGFGESLPVSDNTTEEGRQLNRRVEMYLE